jgi:hypothetical protein
MFGFDFVVLDMRVPAADFFLVHSFCWHATAHFGVALGTSAPRACMIRLVAKGKDEAGNTIFLLSFLYFISVWGA